ncbi:YpiF family protein [Lentibacillus sp.]|uniref:YpiF family protein n=1 Tax=Lentibacillus sp. TaxID=1925746 RepID=UPI002B4AB990|nr:YpiF family protein [Lentibacillus sp.]HLS08274.1 YpiF family protein [Lentibacillus sp.]
MKWTRQDLDQYVQAKEYVDTVIVPLIPFHISDDAGLGKDALQREVMSLFTRELERELSGRILLFPDYHYLKSAGKEAEAERINAWIEDIRYQPFHHIFFITADSGWKKLEQDMQGTLIWLPAIVTESTKARERQSVIHSQVQQVTELIRSYWKDNK